MQIQLAHLFIKSKDQNGQPIDIVYIIEDLHITEEREIMPIYELESNTHHCVARGKSLTKFEGVGYLFHKGPSDPRSNWVNEFAEQRKLNKEEHDDTLERIKNIELE